jgi:hypothetical protein
MSLLKKMFAVACFALLPAFVTPADPVVAKHIAKDAKWYIHLDFAAAKQTVLYSTVLDAVRAHFPLDDTLAQVKQFLDVDPLTDINGFTVYNNSFEKDVAAIIVYAKVNPERFGQALAQNPDFKETRYNNHALLSWTDNNDGKHKNGCFYAPGIVLMADREATLKMAVDVLDGTTPAESPLAKKPEAAGAFLYGSADLAQAPDKNVSQLLSNSEAATASLGETDGKLKLAVNITARSPQTGVQLKKLLDGVKAFGELAASRDLPTAAALLQQVELTVDGTHISATFTHDSKTLLQTIQKLDAEHKAKGAGAPAAAGDKPQGL